MTTIERTYAGTSPESIWQLWTTASGIESWWAPDGFSTVVTHLDLRDGGDLVYVMTATAPDQIEFMNNAGMPLSTESRKTFTLVDEPRQIAYRSLIDFVPDHEPYQHLTTVMIATHDAGCRVVMEMEDLHDETWTERLVAGRNNELDNLARVLAREGN